jgi:malate permease and related proteins
MENIALLAVSLVIGIVLRAGKRLPDGAHTVLNGFVVNVALPAMTLFYLRKLSPTLELFAAAAMPWSMFALGCVFFAVTARMARWDRATTGGLILTGSLANTSFIGLPMIAAFFGAGGLATGVVIDQLGSYCVLSTLGLLVAGVCAPQGKAPGLRAIVLRIVQFPPLIATVVAFATSGIALPAWCDGVLEKLAATLAPLALISIGLQLRLGALRNCAAALATGLGFKLVLAPLAIVAIFAPLARLDGSTFDLVVFEAAMAPMIGATIVAAEHKLNPPLVTLMAGIGIPLSFLTLPIWHAVLVHVI